MEMAAWASVRFCSFFTNSMWISRGRRSSKCSRYPNLATCFIETMCRWLGWKFNDAKLKLVWKGVWRFSCYWNILTPPIYSFILNNAREPKCKLLWSCQHICQRGSDLRSCSDKSIIFDTVVQHHLFMQEFLNKMSGVSTALLWLEGSLSLFLVSVLPLQWPIWCCWDTDGLCCKWRSRHKLPLWEKNTAEQLEWMSKCSLADVFLQFLKYYLCVNVCTPATLR